MHKEARAVKSSPSQLGRGFELALLLDLLFSIPLMTIEPTPIVLMGCVGAILSFVHTVLVPHIAFWNHAALKENFFRIGIGTVGAIFLGATAACVGVLCVMSLLHLTEPMLRGFSALGKTSNFLFGLLIFGISGAIAANYIALLSVALQKRLRTSALYPSRRVILFSSSLSAFICAAFFLLLFARLSTYPFAAILLVSSGLPLAWWWNPARNDHPANR